MEASVRGEPSRYAEGIETYRAPWPQMQDGRLTENPVIPDIRAQGNKNVGGSIGLGALRAAHGIVAPTYAAYSAWAEADKALENELVRIHNTEGYPAAVKFALTEGAVGAAEWVGKSIPKHLGSMTTRLTGGVFGVTGHLRHVSQHRGRPERNRRQTCLTT